METSGIVVFTLWYIALAVMYITGDLDSLRGHDGDRSPSPMDLREPQEGTEGKKKRESLEGKEDREGKEGHGGQEGQEGHGGQEGHEEEKEHRQSRFSSILDDLKRAVHDVEPEVHAVQDAVEEADRD